MKQSAKSVLDSQLSQAMTLVGAARHGEALLLGCSAGGDSMALLDLVARYAEKNGCEIVVAHFDHAQRPESREEAKFVAARCREIGCRFISERWEGKRNTSRSKSRSGNGRNSGGKGDGAEVSEAEMREARYAFFKRAMRKSKADYLLLAHQADDRAETFLMRLLSGSGPTGLASIRARETVEGMTVLRPLLGFRREELREHLRSRKLDWREDASNEDERRKRSWVRRAVMPLLDERMGLEVAPRIARASELIEEETAALDSLAAFALARLTSPSPAPPAAGQLFLKREIWRSAPTPLRRRLIRDWLWNLAASPHPPTYAAVEEALKFAERSKVGLELRTVGRIHIVKQAGRLVAFVAKVGERTRARYFTRQ